MSLKDEITEAIAAHELWRDRLLEGIRTGNGGGLREPAADDQCEFGKWLYGSSIPKAMKASAGYRQCRDLHARFHVVAAGVYELAMAGRQAEVENAMRDGGEFLTLTSGLIDALVRWQREFRVICAWCGSLLKEPPDPEAPVSHSICEACVKRC